MSSERDAPVPAAPEEIAHRLQAFADQQSQASPLYAHLAAGAAEDAEVAGLLTAAGQQRAWPTLLLAAAHRLLQAEPLHPLTRYYPTLGGFDGIDRETWPMFRQFLTERAGSAREIIATRSTQTNEVGRAAVLYPALAWITEHLRGGLAVLELGASAGLLLGLDRFGYRYHLLGSEQIAVGKARAAVGLHCAVDLAEDAQRPPLPKKLTLAARVGLDAEPVDASDEDELAWLEACVWADQPDRARLLRAAAAEQAGSPPELVRGDAVTELAAALDRLGTDRPAVVLTSHLLRYLSEPAALRDELARLAAERELWWVVFEDDPAALAALAPEGAPELAAKLTGGQSLLAVVRFRTGAPQVTVLARAAPHGQRMTWLA